MPNNWNGKIRLTIYIVSTLGIFVLWLGGTNWLANDLKEKSVEAALERKENRTDIVDVKQYISRIDSWREAQQKRTERLDDKLDIVSRLTSRQVVISENLTKMVDELRKR